MKKVLILLAFAFFSTEGFSQVYQNVMSGTGGGSGMIVRAKNSNIGAFDGSVYLFEDWKPGKIEFADGSVPVSGDVKFDILENILVVKGADGVENTFKAPVKSFSIQDGADQWMVFRNGFKGKGIKPADFFQEIYGGVKAKVLKKEIRTLLESKGYNTSSSFKVDAQQQFYIGKEGDGDLIEIKRDVKNIAEVLGAPSLIDYAKANKLNLKKEADFKKLLMYFETL